MAAVSSFTPNAAPTFTPSHTPSNTPSAGTPHTTNELTMLHQHTLNQLRGLRLDGMIAAINDTTTQASAEALGRRHRLPASGLRASVLWWPLVSEWRQSDAIMASHRRGREGCWNIDKPGRCAPLPARRAAATVADSPRWPGPALDGREGPKALGGRPQHASPAGGVEAWAGESVEASAGCAELSGGSTPSPPLDVARSVSLGGSRARWWPLRATLRMAAPLPPAFPCPSIPPDFDDREEPSGRTAPQALGRA
jgi:hypothetical protein